MRLQPVLAARPPRSQDINRAAVEAFADWPRARFRVLDVSAFEKRADGHPGGNDCLHYCVAGPAGVWWNRMLYHVLSDGEPEEGGGARAKDGAGVATQHDAGDRGDSAEQ